MRWETPRRFQRGPCRLKAEVEVGEDGATDAGCNGVCGHLLSSPCELVNIMEQNTNYCLEECHSLPLTRPTAVLDLIGRKSVSTNRQYQQINPRTWHLPQRNISLLLSPAMTSPCIGHLYQLHPLFNTCTGPTSR